MKHVFTEEEKQYMLDNYQDKTYVEIAKDLGLTDRQVRGWVNGHGLKKLTPINGNYFDNIDTPLKAYFLGLIYADGCIYHTVPYGYYFILVLQSQDIYVLEKLKQELNAQCKLIHRDPYEHEILGTTTMSHDLDRLIINSKPLYQSLIKQNIVPRKTYSDIFPQVEEKYFFDYLRGYIDGDGCYCINSHGKLRTSIICNSKKNLEYIQSRLLKYDIHTHILPCKNHYVLSCSREKDNFILLHHLYYEDDVFCLQRKYDKIKHLLGSAA